MKTLYYQKALDDAFNPEEGFEVIVIDSETKSVVWTGKVSKLVDNNAH